jgi:hypothetical protein
MLEHLQEVDEQVQDLRIEDQIVENSNQEIEYLNSKHDELTQNLEGIQNEISTKKQDTEFNKTSDLAAIV